MEKRKSYDPMGFVSRAPTIADEAQMRTIEISALLLEPQEHLLQRNYEIFVDLTRYDRY